MVIMNNKSTLILANEFNDLMKLMEFAEMEKDYDAYDNYAEQYNEVVKELWNRLPNLKEDSDIQLKVRRRVK